MNFLGDTAAYNGGEAGTEGKIWIYLDVEAITVSLLNMYALMWYLTNTVAVSSRCRELEVFERGMDNDAGRDGDTIGGIGCCSGRDVSGSFGTLK